MMRRLLSPCWFIGLSDFAVIWWYMVIWPGFLSYDDPWSGNPIKQQVSGDDRGLWTVLKVVHKRFGDIDNGGDNWLMTHGSKYQPARSGKLTSNMRTSRLWTHNKKTIYAHIWRIGRFHRRSFLSVWFLTHFNAKQWISRKCCLCFFNGTNVYRNPKLVFGSVSIRCFNALLYVGKPAIFRYFQCLLMLQIRILTFA